jgi:hypothetical protein
MGIAPGFCTTLFRDVWWCSTGLTISYCYKALYICSWHISFESYQICRPFWTELVFDFFFPEVPDEFWENVNWSSKFLSYCMSSFFVCYVTFALERLSSNNQWFIQIKLEFNFNVNLKIMQLPGTKNRIFSFLGLVLHFFEDIFDWNICWNCNCIL